MRAVPAPSRADCRVDWSAQLLAIASLQVLRMTLEAMKLLHLCDYAHEEVCCILAHATVIALLSNGRQNVASALRLCKFCLSVFLRTTNGLLSFGDLRKVQNPVFRFWAVHQDFSEIAHEYEL